MMTSTETPRLKILKESLGKKERLFDQKLAEHFDDVKSANGQPINDKSNGTATSGRWDRQSDAMRTLKHGIEKTMTAIDREERKISDVAAADTPDFLQAMVSDGVLKQWRKHPNAFFVTGVDKARIVWDAKNFTLSHRYISGVSKEQYPLFRDAFNRANAAARKLRTCACTAG